MSWAATYLPSLSYFVGTLVVILHGIYFLAKRLFVTKEDFETLKEAVTRGGFLTERVIHSLDEINASVKEGNALTKELVEANHKVDKRLAVVESRVSAV